QRVHHRTACIETKNHYCSEAASGSEHCQQLAIFHHVSATRISFFHPFTCALQLRVALGHGQTEEEKQRKGHQPVGNWDAGDESARPYANCVEARENENIK